MLNEKKFLVSHAPFWHIGRDVPTRNYNILIATIPAILGGFFFYGLPALGVICLSIASAMLWEYLFMRLSKQKPTIGDGSAAVIGALYGMLLPATAPWWLVITGTLLAILIGKQIFGGIGGNPFCPPVLAVALLMISWTGYFDFEEALLTYDFSFKAAYPLTSMKYFGLDSIASFTMVDLLLGKQIGGLGATFGLGLILGGIYLILRGFIRWEIAVSFLVGVFITALIFKIVAPESYAGPFFHLFTGYTLIGAFFLATEDSSSPVNFIPMVLYGLLGGLLTVLIRNIGAWVDGVIFAILFINLINPLLDKIKPKALGKVA
jgi:electron transport complex protein RnfD